MWGILIPLLVGVAVGYFSPGKADKSRLFVRGLLWSVLIAAVIAALGYFFDMNPLGFGDTGFLGLVISFVVAIAIFLVGVWIGDALEHRKGRAAPPAGPRV